MRILALVFLLLLATPVVTAETAQAQTGTQQTPANMDDLRTSLRGALNAAHQFLGSLFSEAKDASGLNDEQLFGVGVGTLTGLLIAEGVGSGGLGTIIFAGGGAVFGKWVTTPK